MITSQSFFDMCCIHLINLGFKVPQILFQWFSHSLRKSRRWRGEELRLIRLFALAILAVIPAQIEAAPPANDLCSGAEVIPSAGPFPFLTLIVDIKDATTSTNDPVPGCADLFSRSIWYTFTPAVTGFYNFSSCSDAPTETTVGDNVMGIYTSLNVANKCAGPFVQVPDSDSSIGCSDESCGPSFHHAAITTQLNANTTYFILVWEYGTTTPTAGNSSSQLRVDKALPPVNDTCATATPVTLNIPISGTNATTIRANNNYELPARANCFIGLGQRASTASGRDVVYSFTAPETANYSIKVQNYNTASDLVLYVAGSCPTGTNYPIQITDCLAAANRNPVSSAEEIPCLHLTSGQQIFIFVDENTVSPGSSFALEVTKCTWESEDNELTAYANTLVCGIEGAIAAGGDIDTYALGTFPAGSRAFVMVDGSAGNITDFALRITTATNTIEFDDNDNDPLFGDSSPNIAGAVLPGGVPIFVRISANQPAEPYRLFAVVQPPWTNATREIEPNNTLLTAQASSKNYFYGWLTNSNPATDIDVYSFTVGSAGELVFVSLDCDPLRNVTPIDGALELLNSRGEVLVSVDDNNFQSSPGLGLGITASTPSFPGEALLFRAPKAGTYYVRVNISSGAPLGAASGDYLLSISKNCFNGATDFGTPPTLVNATAISPIGEGNTTTVTGNIFDPDAGDAHTVVINWGDETTTLTFDPGVTNFMASHYFSDDNSANSPSSAYTINLAVFDHHGDNTSTNIFVIVTNVPPLVTSAILTANPINENGSVTLNGAFSDPGFLDTHRVVIDWGDGTPNSTNNLSSGFYNFSSAHQYLDDKPSSTAFDYYSIKITVSDNNGGTTFTNVSLRVNNLAPVLSNLAITSPILQNQTATLTGNLSDVGTRDTFTLTVNWGDGAPLLTTNYPAGTTAFGLTHVYATAGVNLPVSVTLTDDDTGSVSNGTVITVQSAQPDPPVFKSITRLVNGHILLELQGTPGATYQIQTSVNLNGWGLLGSRTADANGLFSIEDPTSSSDPKWFYRAIWP